MTMAAAVPAISGPDLPHNIEIEQALLGACLIRPSCLDEIADSVEPEHFFAALHGRIFSAMRDLHGKGEVINPLKLRGLFAADPDLKELGGPNYIQQLAIDAPSIINATDMARAVKALAIRRSIIAQAQSVIADATSCPMGDTASAMIERAEAAMAAVRGEGEVAGTTFTLGAAALTAIHQFEDAAKAPEFAGVRTGFTALDDVVGGMREGDIIILGGQTSMGKTALAQQVAWNAATAGKPVLFFSLEMRAHHVAGRFLAQQVGVSADKLEAGRFDNAVMRRAIDAAEQMSAIPMIIDSMTYPTIDRMRSRVRWIMRKTGLRLIVVDHLGHVAAPDQRAREHERISQIVRGFEMMADEFSIPILLLSQLNRELFKRDSRKPSISDLYGSSAIEQVADAIMLIHREEYFLLKEQPDGTDAREVAEWSARMDAARGKVEINVAKQRRGATGLVTLNFDAALTRFSDPAQDARDNAERLL